MSPSCFLAMSGTVAVSAAWPTGSSINNFSLAGRPSRALEQEAISRVNTLTLDTAPVPSSSRDNRLIFASINLININGSLDLYFCLEKLCFTSLYIYNSFHFGHIYEGFCWKAAARWEHLYFVGKDEDSLKNCEVKVWIDFRLSSSRGQQSSRAVVVL